MIHENETTILKAKESSRDYWKKTIKKYNSACGKNTSDVEILSVWELKLLK